LIVMFRAHLGWVGSTQKNIKERTNPTQSSEKKKKKKVFFCRCVPIRLHHHQFCNPRNSIAQEKFQVVGCEGVRGPKKHHPIVHPCGGGWVLPCRFKPESSHRGGNVQWISLKKRSMTEEIIKNKQQFKKGKGRLGDGTPRFDKQPPNPCERGRGGGGKFPHDDGEHHHQQWPATGGGEH